MEIKLGGNGIEYTFLEDGSWFYKATPMKKMVRETPQIKVVEKIEENYLKAFERRLRFAVRDVEKYLQ